MNNITNKTIKGSIIAAFIIILLGAGCSSTKNAYEKSGSPEPENPYSSGSGHSAGYEWAERTGGDCSGSSASFNEGCEEYYRQ